MAEKLYAFTLTEINEIKQKIEAGIQLIELDIKAEGFSSDNVESILRMKEALKIIDTILSDHNG